MGGVWKIHNSVVAVPNEKGTLPQLWSAVVYGVDLKAVHVILRLLDLLEVICERADNRSRLLIRV